MSKKPRHLRLVVDNTDSDFAPVEGFDDLFESNYEETVDRFSAILSEAESVVISYDRASRHESSLSDTESLPVSATQPDSPVTN
ncbi:hypothetical protein KF728_12705 [Candidatus Obscuribacterales bacterium]|nr:hypothetical protein [Candidatus Obscuribacterales bacterium]MBX3151003.1 hypothetical protein [Candidatus Obscuribacterales bacterium]